MADFTEKTRFSWPIVVVAVTAALTIGAAHVRLQSLDTSYTEHLKDASDRTRTDHSHELRIQRLEDSFVRVERALERIDRKIDGIAETNRFAGGPKK